jgi:hypothetical protein
MEMRESSRLVAEREVRRVLRDQLLMAGAALLVGAFGVGLIAADVPVRLAMVPVLLGVVWLGVFLVALSRTWAAGRHLRTGPQRWVKAVGWCRPGDGCNYGIFLDAGATPDSPDLVMRLPLRRRPLSTEGWLIGEPGAFGLLLTTESGEFLGAGRIVQDSTAIDRWNRRDQPPGRLTQTPPDWEPPGGH